jgi:hypothetical protein
MAGADGQPWPCRSAWLLAFQWGSLADRPRLRESAASIDYVQRPLSIVLGGWGLTSMTCKRRGRRGR